MKRKSRRLSVTALAIAGFLVIGGICLAADSDSIKLSYKIVDSYADTENVSLALKLQVRNISAALIRNVNVTLLHQENISIDTESIYLGDILPGQTLLSPISFTISEKRNNSSQKNVSDSQLSWRVEYTKDTGEYVTEEIPYTQ